MNSAEVCELLPARVYIHPAVRVPTVDISPLLLCVLRVWCCRQHYKCNSSTCKADFETKVSYGTHFLGESCIFIPMLILLFSVIDVYPTSAIRTKCVKIEISENEIILYYICSSTSKF